MKVLGCVLVFGRVATADVTALQAKPQVDPMIAHLHAFFTHVNIGSCHFNGFQMAALFRHGTLLLAFQGFAVPLTQIGCGVIGALQKAEQHVPGRIGDAHIVVHQQEFFHHRMIISGRGIHLSLGETGGLRRGVGVESWAFDVSSAWPEASAANLM
jgi:hypothetical protein